MMKTIDLNADMGEGFGPYRVADDAALMPYLTSANIAGGFHAGDPQTMRRTTQLAAEHGVAVGVHPGYRDLVGFGRRELAATPEELRDDVLYQLGALREMARFHGQRVQHLKLHGALYMRAARDRDLSRVILEGVQRVDPNLVVFCMRASETFEVAREMGQPVAAEFYADRDYGEDGAIVFTRTPPRLEPDAVAERVLRAVTEGKVLSASGQDVPIEFSTICVHSDTPGVADIARAIRERLGAAGVRLEPVGDTLAPA
jgi:5-oxoprolinase (ATP-hydrolysing) subunit A